MDRCRRTKIHRKSEVGEAMIFPPKGDGEQCLGREAGRGESRPQYASLPLRIPTVRGDGALVGSGRRDVNCWSQLDATTGSCVAAFRLSRSTGVGTCNRRLPTVAGARSLSCCAPFDA